MRNTAPNPALLIAARELKAYLGTWSAYLIAAAGLFLTGILFNAYAVGTSPKLSADVVADFFYFASGIEMGLALLLSMRLLAEEKQMGTMLYLRTSPLSARQVIYGKATSALALMGLFLLLTLPYPLLVLLHGKISLGHLFAGYVGLGMLGAACVAIATFASCLAPNQLLAAVGGALCIVTLLSLWMLAGVVGPPFQDFFSYLALHNQHFNPFARGTIRLRDLVYYASVAFFFLEAAVKALELQDEGS